MSVFYKITPDPRFVDIGVYGVPKRPGFDVYAVTRRIEDFVRYTTSTCPTEVC